MTAMVDAGDTASVVLTARRSIRAHKTGRLCHFGCPGNDTCRQHAWAREILPEDDQQ